MEINKKGKVLIIFNVIVAILSLLAFIFYASLAIGFIDAVNEQDPNIGTGIAIGFSAVFMILAMIGVAITSVIGIILFLVAKFSSANLKFSVAISFLTYHLLAVCGAVLSFIIITWGHIS